MRCKIGDIAVFVKSRHPENIGKLVEVVDVSDLGVNDWKVKSLGGSLKAYGYTTKLLHLANVSHTIDENLRPLRDEEGESEELRFRLKEPV